MLLMFTRSVTSGLFLESSGTPLMTTQLATTTTTINSQSVTLSKPQSSLHPSTSILSASHDTILKTSSTIQIKKSQKLTASKTESLQNSHVRTQKKESTVLATKLSTEPITIMTSATSSKTLSPSKSVFTLTSIQPTLSLKMAESSSKSLQTDIPKSISSSGHLSMPMPSSTVVNNGKLDTTETLSASSTIETIMSHQSLPSSHRTGIVSSSVLQENNSQTKVIHLMSASAGNLLSSTPVQFHQTQSSVHPQSISSNFHSSISLERKMPETVSSQDIKSSILPSSVQHADSSLRLSTMQSDQKSMSFSKTVDLETSHFSSIVTTSQINGTKILAVSNLKITTSSLSKSDNYSVTSELETSQFYSSSIAELSRNFQLFTPSPTIQILNTKWNNTDTISMFPSSSLFGNKSSAIFQPSSSFSADWMKTYTYSSIELSSTQMTIGVIAPTMTPSLSSANLSNLQILTSSSSEIQETLFPSSSLSSILPKGSETSVSSQTGNQSLTLLTTSAVHQENTTFIPTSTLVSKTESFLIPTLSIKPYTSSTSSKLFTPHSKTTIIPSSSSEKLQNHSMMSNDLPTNPTTTRVVHTTETMYYPTHRIPQKYNATIELTFNGQCEPLHTRRTYEHFVDNVQTLICKKLRVEHEHVIVHNLTCASVHIHVTFLNITTTNLTGHLQDLINRNKMNVTVYGNQQELHYQGTALKMVPFPKSITEILARSEEKNTEVVVIIIASAIIVLLVLVGLIVFGRECYRRKRSQTFDLTSTPHVHLKMEDFTLTRIPRTGAWYSDEGVTIQRFSETNGSNIVKSSNGVRKQPAISCISDMLREKESSGAQLRQFSYTILPSDRRDSQDTTVSTASDGNFRHSTDSLVARQNSNMHGAVNPIYLGDEFPRLLPSAHAEQQSDLVNGQRDNKALRRK